MHRTRILTALALLFVISLMAASSPATAGEKVTILLRAEVLIAEDSGASSNVREECKLGTKLTQFIKTYAKNPTVTLRNDPIDEAEGKVLILEIVNVVGPGGGVWSGAKSIRIKGELLENGEVIGTFTAARFSGGGAFGAYKGTCSILGRCVKASGSDIAKWLANPTMNAMLGDA